MDNKCKTAVLYRCTVNNWENHDCAFYKARNLTQVCRYFDPFSQGCRNDNAQVDATRGLVKIVDNGKERTVIKVTPQ